MPWEAILPTTLAALTGILRPPALSLESRTGAMASQLDSAEFTAFYQRSARPLWAYLARVSGDRTLADDLTQESFVRFLTAPGTPADGEVESRRYLFRIATNLLRDHWRRPPTTPLDELPELYLATGSSGSEARILLGPALLKLRPRDRQLLWLAYAEGYSHREIAEVTGLASASIRLLLFRARQKMATLLRQQPPPDSSASTSLEPLRLRRQP